MDNAEESVRRVIDRIGDGRFDYVMDDGAPLAVRIAVDRAGAQRRGRFHRHRAAAMPDNFNARPR